MTSTEGSRPRGRPRVEIDESALLDASVAVFAADGFVGARVQDVAERAGITQPMIYRRFGTKDGLLDWTIEHEVRFLTEFLFAAYDASRGQSLEEALRAGISAIVRYAVARPDGFELMFFAHADLRLPRQDPTEKVRSVVTDRIEALVAERLQATGKDLQRAPALLAAAIVGSTSHVARSCIGEDPVAPEAAEQLLLEMLGNGLRGLSDAALRAPDG